jgi:hypothetical protein
MAEKHTHVMELRTLFDKPFDRLPHSGTSQDVLRTPLRMQSSIIELPAL